MSENFIPMGKWLTAERGSVPPGPVLHIVPPMVDRLLSFLSVDPRLGVSIAHPSQQLIHDPKKSKPLKVEPKIIGFLRAAHSNPEIIGPDGKTLVP